MIPDLRDTFRVGGGWINNPNCVTTVVLSRVRKWCDALLGMKSELVFERIGETNLVALRYRLASGTVQATVRALWVIMGTRCSPETKRSRVLNELAPVRRSMRIAV